MEANLFQVNISRQPPVTIVSLGGRLDALTSKDFREKVMAEIDAGSQRMVLDLGGLDYVSSAGLRVLLEARKSIRARDGQIVLANVQPFARTVLASTGFDTLFTLYETPEEARAALAV